MSACSCLFMLVHACLCLFSYFPLLRCWLPTTKPVVDVLMAPFEGLQRNLGAASEVMARCVALPS